MTSPDRQEKPFLFQGLILYYPDVETQPVVLDLQWFTSLITLSYATVDDVTLRNGSRCPALPRTVPLFTQDQLLSLWSRLHPTSVSSLHEYMYVFSTKLFMLLFLYNTVV